MVRHPTVLRGEHPEGAVEGRPALPLPRNPSTSPYSVAPETPRCVFQGNDQIRFELTCYSLAPQIKVGCCSSPERVGTGG